MLSWRGVTFVDDRFWGGGGFGAGGPRGIPFSERNLPLLIDAIALVARSASDPQGAQVVISMLNVDASLPQASADKLQHAIQSALEQLRARSDREAEAAAEADEKS